jgi:hypothetical protein
MACEGLRKGEVDFDGLKKRLSRLRRMFRYHELAEDEVLLPAVAERIEHVTRLYEMDHEGVNRLFEHLEDAIKDKNAFETVRATASVKAAVELHLSREEGHLLRVCEEILSKKEQKALAREIAAHIPRDKFAAMVKWMFSKMDHDDRVGMVRAWKKSMPPPILAISLTLVQSALSEGDWDRLRPLVKGH